jgi:four helix bundle protein
MEVRSHRDLHVWRKGMDLVAECYKLTEAFPARERFGLSSQLQRAAMSVPSNIAEGHARQSTGAFVNHLSIANGSLAEIETLLLITVRLNYTTREAARAVLALNTEVGRMLGALKRKLALSES